MELNIKTDLTQTLGVREMHELIEINIKSGKKFECLFLNKEQALQVVEKLQSFIDPKSENVEILPLFGFKTEWQKLKRELELKGTVGEMGNYFAMFKHGWQCRTKQSFLHEP